MVAESTFTAIKIKAMQLPKIDYEESKTKSHATSETTIFYGSKLDSRPFVPSEHFSESQTMPCQWKLVCVLDFNEIVKRKADKGMNARFLQKKEREKSVDVNLFHSSNPFFSNIKNLDKQRMQGPTFGLAIFPVAPSNL